MHGRVLALQTVLLIGTTPIGSPVLGAVADAWGGRAPLVIGGIAALVTAAWGYWMDRRLRRGRPDQADAEPTAAADQDRTPETVISPLPT